MAAKMRDKYASTPVDNARGKSRLVVFKETHVNSNLIDG